MVAKAVKQIHMFIMIPSYFKKNVVLVIQSNPLAIQLLKFLMVMGLLAGTGFVQTIEPSFDCAKAKAWSEIQVCNDKTLADLDQQSANLFKNSKVEIKGSAQKSLIADQKLWLREREACKNHTDQQGCLIAVYQKRIQQLNPESQTAQVQNPKDNTSLRSQRFPSRTFSSKAVWNPPSELPLKIASDYCPSMWPNEDEIKRIKCITSKMADTGASPEAIRFVELSQGEEYLSEFRELGVVDLAALSMFSYNSPELEHLEILVNDQSSIFDLIEQSLNVDIRKHPLYTKLTRKFPEAKLSTIFSFEEAQKLPKNGQRFVFHYTLLNGCRACEPAGSARIAYDFDINGRFQGAELLELKITESQP